MKKHFILIFILLIASFLRFYKLMHDSPYFFNPDERNMGLAVTRLILPEKLSAIPSCIISEFFYNRPKTNDQRPTTNCSLNPHFFAYGQFPLYLAYASDQLSKPITSLFTKDQQLATNDQRLTTNFPSAVFWLRFWSAFLSVSTVLIVYFISRQILPTNYSLITAALAAFTPGLIQSAHFGTTESLLTFFFLLVIYLSMKLSKNLKKINSHKYPASAGSRLWRNLILISLSIGFSLGSKLTGIFFLIPPVSVLLIEAFKSAAKKQRFLTHLLKLPSLAITLIVLTLFFFVFSSPYNLVEPKDFKSAVFGYESDVATGKYEAFYTRQFVKSIPFLFQFEKIFPYALGWPIFILASFGFILIILKIIKTPKKTFPVFYILLITSFVVYLIPNAVLFAKWTRFMTPILPFFSIFSGYFIFKLFNYLCHSDQAKRMEESLANARNLKQVERSLDSLRSLGMTKLVYLLLCILVFISVLPGIAFMSIYTHEDTRITASKWIYNNLPDKSYFLSETANVVDIPLGLPNDQRPTTNDQYTVISFDFYHLDENPELFTQLLNHLEKADYIFIPSRRIFKNFPKFSQKYKLVTKYYQLLFSGALGFDKVAEFSSYPALRFGLINLPFPDENAEETFTVFDHPVIRIYKKFTPLTKNEYHSLFINHEL